MLLISANCRLQRAEHSYWFEMRRKETLKITDTYWSDLCMTSQYDGDIRHCSDWIRD